MLLLHFYEHFIQQDPVLAHIHIGFMIYAIASWFFVDQRMHVPAADAVLQ